MLAIRITIHPQLRFVLALAALAAAIAAAAHAAPAPVTWCGDAPIATDRPDVAGSNEIHVIYSHPSGSPDRFMTLASAIATDLRGIDSWWRKQDATRAPRFDLASLGCSGFASLDLSDVELPHDTAYYNGTTQPRLALLRDDLVASGFADPAKKYLVYYDQAQPSAAGDCGAAFVNAHTGGAAGYAGVFIAPNLESTVPGRPCGTIEAGAARGGYLAVITAHELVNALGALDTATPGPPHRCPGDALHPCDNSLDVLAPTPTALTLDTALLDFGHDDYYAHAGSFWDVQDSPWLRHLDEPEYKLRISVGAGGLSVVDTAQGGLSCAPGTCTWTWQAGSGVGLVATAAKGYRLLGWNGCPSAAGPVCALTMNGPTTVGAVFARPLGVAGFHLAFARNPLRLTAKVRLSRKGVASAVVCRLGRRQVISSSLRAGVATCTWSIPKRLQGNRLQGAVELGGTNGVLLTRPFHVTVPR